MKKDIYNLWGVLSLSLFIILASINLIIGNLIHNFIHFHYLILLLSIFFFIKAFTIKKIETREWTCQKCKTKLLRNQIKFGLCPVCGVKVKGFRGEVHIMNK